MEPRFKKEDLESFKIIGWYVNFSSEQILLNTLREQLGPYQLVDFLRRSCKHLKGDLRILCRPEYIDTVKKNLRTRATEFYVDKISIREIPEGFWNDDFVDGKGFLFMDEDYSWNKLESAAKNPDAKKDTEEGGIRKEILYFLKVWHSTDKSVAVSVTPPVKLQLQPVRSSKRLNITDYVGLLPSVVQLYDEELAARLEAFYKKNRE